MKIIVSISIPEKKISIAKTVESMMELRAELTRLEMLIGVP